MPARQSLGGGKKTPKVRDRGKAPKAPKASVPSKSDPGARKANASYGPGPVTVYTTPRGNPQTSRRAIKAINRSVGAKVFKPVGRRVAADVVVRRKTTANLTKAYGPRTGGLTTAGGLTGGPVKGQVAINAKSLRDKASKSWVVYAKQHELGHAVGLAHPGPKKDPYVSKGPKRRVAGGGVMGSAPELNRSEVRRIRRLRGLQALASKPAIPKRKAAKKTRRR